MEENINSLLGIIPVYEKESDISTSTENIIINNSQNYPVLQYKITNEFGQSSWVRVDGSDSPKRSAKMSDLEYFLRERDWNIGFGRKVVAGGVEEDDYPLYMLDCESPLKACLIFNDESKIALVSDHNNSPTSLAEFNDLYETLMNIKPMTYTFKNTITGTEEDTVNLGATYYYNLVSTRDLDTGSTVVDLLSLGDSNYTNTLNLNGLISSDLDSNITLGIDYTVNGNVYTKEVSFNPIDSIENNSPKSRDIIINILDYVTIDFHDFCLRAFPVSVDVNECIISYCYITYYGNSK